MDALYVVNPRAGRGRGETIARDLPGLLGEHGLKGEVVRTSAPREAIDVARRGAESFPMVVAVGGDGTAHEVANGLAETEATLGVIPVGSGNDLALALDLPGETREAVRVLAEGEERRIDLGRFDDGWFANSLGMGFEAQVTIESLEIRRLRGFAIYLWAVVKALKHLRCPDFRILADGREIPGRRLLVCVGNGPRVGGGFFLTPDAVNDDGLLDVCLVAEMGRMKVLRTLPKAIGGTHGREPGVEFLRAKVLEFESEDGFPFHADGEVVDERRRKLRIEIVPGALKARVPRKTTGEKRDG